MYQEIFESYKNALPDFPSSRRPLVGSIIKEIRIDKGIRQDVFANKTRINLSTLKSIENDHQKATTVANLESCAKELGILTQDLILMGREMDPANYFVCKKSAPLHIEGIRKRKKSPESWRQTVRLRFPDFDLTPISPPINSRKDFLFYRINLPPKRKIVFSNSAINQPLIGFINTGFNIQIRYAKNTHSITANQGFLLDTFYSHEIYNDDEDQAAVIYLIGRLPRINKTVSAAPDTPLRNTSIDVANALDKLREKFSNRPRRKIAIRHLADLTDNLDHEQIAKMMRIRKGSSIVYWSKIEDLLAATGTTMEEFILWAQKLDQPSFSLATLKTRAIIEHPTYGLKIYSAIPPNTGGHFFCGELILEGKNTIQSESWYRKDQAMVGLYVEQGEVEITVGRRRSALSLSKGEHIYFDGNLGYRLRNPLQKQMKGFLATSPGIQF